MSVNLTNRGTGVQFQYANDSAPGLEPVAIAGEGPLTATTRTPTGQGLTAGVPVLYIDANATDPGSVLMVGKAGSAGAKVMTQAPIGRVALSWVAGARGKPGINADIQNAAESVRMVTDPDFEIGGVNGTSALCTFNPEGGILLTTAGADGDEMILRPHLDANQSAWTQWTWGTDKQTVWECVIQTGAAITNSIVWAGLKLTSTEVTATDADQVFVRYENGVNSGKFQAINSIGGVDVADDSGVTVAVSTNYHIKIAIDADRIAKTYINGVLVSTSLALTTATDLIPYIGVAADGAAEAKTLTVYGANIARSVA